MKIRLLTSFAGRLGSHDSPNIGAVIDVPDALGAALCDGERAEAVVAGKPAIEAAATAGAPERAVRQPATKRKGA